MNLAFLPDLFALAMLVAILLLVRRKYSDHRTNAWLVGLFITLIESVAHTFYAPDGVPLAVLHIVVIDCYIVAGLVFVWGSGEPAEDGWSRNLSLVLNGVGLLALGTTYGANVRAAQAYAPALALGAVCGIASSLLFRRNLLFAALQAVSWGTAAALIAGGRYREAVYWAIGAVYVVAALNFWKALENGNLGRLTIVAGFTMWSLFFFLHPWVVFHRNAADLASHFWNLQKSLISMGMILALLEQKASSEAYLAHHDELTGLPNRRMFAARLESAVVEAERRSASLALIMVDLDGFKAINDTQGHEAGDHVLREVAAQLRLNVRATDTVARIGGDEFIILADGLANEAAAWRLAESVCGAVGPIAFQGIPIPVSASVGVAMYPDDGLDPIKLLRVADQRMYGHKKGPAAVRLPEPVVLPLVHDRVLRIAQD